MIDYLNELRESCLEAYTGIVQGLKGDGETPSREYSWWNYLFDVLFGRFFLCLRAQAINWTNVNEIIAIHQEWNFTENKLDMLAKNYHWNLNFI